MTSFLGIPITSGERVICNLYLADKDGGPFTEEDEEALRTLAVQAAIAIENARLYEGLKDLTRLKERERIAFDLHDGAIQSLYGIGVRLDSCIEELPETSIQLRDDLNTAVDELSNITRRIRNYILNLQTEELEERDLPDALSVLLQELSVNALMSTNLEVDSSSDEEQPQKVTPEQTRQLVGIAREALTNVLEHSRATSVTANLSFPANKLVLRIRDNGVGFPAGAPSPRGRGLRDMHERTRALGGDLLIEPQPGGGTAVTVSLDLGPGEQEEGNLGGDDA
jgi:signal transduction histidine kinase